MNVKTRWCLSLDFVNVHKHTLNTHVCNLCMCMQKRACVHTHAYAPVPANLRAFDHSHLEAQALESEVQSTHHQQMATMVDKLF